MLDRLYNIAFTMLMNSMKYLQQMGLNLNNLIRKHIQQQKDLMGSILHMCYLKACKVSNHYKRLDIQLSHLFPKQDEYTLMMLNNYFHLNKLVSRYCLYSNN